MSVAPLARARRKVVGAWALVVLATVALVAPLSAGPADAVGSARGGTTSPAVSPETRRGVMAAVCQGASHVKPDRSGCEDCPSYTPDVQDLGEIVVDPIEIGSFVTPNAREAYVGLFGCDGKPNQYGGGVLLRKVGTAWKVVRYDEGLAPVACVRYPYRTGTTLLVCPAGYSAQGYVVETIGAQYIGPASTSFRPLLTVQSNEANCDPDVDVMVISSWKQVDVDGDKRLDLRALVQESHSRRSGQDCADPTPAKNVRHTLDFRFDGVRFTPTKPSARTVACLASFPEGTGRSGVYCPPSA